MVRIDQDEIDRVRKSADIVDVVSHYIQVQKKGKDYVALCPFHNDHSPSMSISPERQIYKCFVCGNGGNVFTFVQNYEKITFPEAVGRVAEMAGIPLSVSTEAYQAPVDPHKQKYYDILNESIRYTMYMVNTAEGLNEKEYMEKRGLDAKVREAFEIGYDPRGDSLTKFLSAKGYDEKDMVGCNVTRNNEHGSFDVFAGRITFPIHDAYGHPIGFSARTIDPENPSKYINTNETDVFIKGDIVYNYHRARNAARHEGKIYICEGVTDVIAFYRAGIQNAVCTLGTSCTEHQISLLRNIGAKLVFCYDGDHAGQAATWRACKMAQKVGCNLSIVLNRTGKDPDEIIRDEGNEALVKMASQEISWMEFVLKYLTENTNLESYLDKKEMVKKAQAEIELLNDEADRQYFTDQLSKITGFRLSITHHQTVREPIDPAIHKLKIPNGTEKAEDQVLRMMMTYSEAVSVYENEIGYLISPDRNLLAAMILDLVHQKRTPDPAALIDATDDQNMKNLISYLAAQINYKEPYDPHKLHGAIRRIQIHVVDAQRKMYLEQLSSELNPERSKILLDKVAECVNSQRRLIDEENSEEDKQ